MKTCTTCKNAIKCGSMGYCIKSKPTQRMKAKHGKIQQTLPEEKHKAWVRDNGLCIYCGRRGQDFHHVYWKPSERIYGKNRNKAENGVILCRSCHRSVTDGDTVIDLFCKNYIKSLYKS